MCFSNPLPVWPTQWKNTVIVMRARSLLPPGQRLIICTLRSAIVLLEAWPSSRARGADVCLDGKALTIGADVEAGLPRTWCDVYSLQMASSWSAHLISLDMAHSWSVDLYKGDAATCMSDEWHPCAARDTRNSTATTRRNTTTTRHECSEIPSQGMERCTHEELITFCVELIVCSFLHKLIKFFCKHHARRIRAPRVTPKNHERHASPSQLTSNTTITQPHIPRAPLNAPQTQHSTTHLPSHFTQTLTHKHMKQAGVENCHAGSGAQKSGAH